MTENGTTPHEAGLVPMTEFLQVCSQLVQRLTLRHGVTFQGARDLYTTLGYQQHLTYQDYYARYRRGGIAQALINAFTEETWRLPPVVREVDDDGTAASAFKDTWDALAQRLKLSRTLERLDRLASLGHYAVLVLGLRGQTDWSTEALPVRGPEDLLYVQVFSEEHSEILELVSEPTSPLFGTPLRYNIDFSRRQASVALASGGVRPSLAGFYGQLVAVHASRVIHVAHDGLEDDIIGTPALQVVWNYLDDLDKLVGGTAEMTWQDAKRRMVAALRDGAVLNAEDAAALDDRIEEFIHGLRNILKVQGIDVTQLAGSVPDASNNIDKLVELIAGTKRIPKRRLLGSERGELASEQDEGNFAVVTIGGRQAQQAAPIILHPLVDRFIALRILPTPPRGYEIEWLPLLTETELEKGNTAKAWAEAIAKQAGPARSPNEVIPDSIFRTDVMGWSPEQEARIQDELGKEEAERLRNPPLPTQPTDVDDDPLADDTDEAA